MPIDLDTGKSFGRLMAEFAERVGLASFGADGRGEPGVPTTVHERALCDRYVNMGYKDFLQADPDWTFLKDEVVLTLSPDGSGPFNVEGDAARYALPPHIKGQPRSNWTYDDEKTIATEIVPRPLGVVLAHRQSIVRVGLPEIASVRTIPGGPLAGKAWELIVYPTPDAAYTIRGLYRVLPYDLVETEQRHIAGAEHDNTILAAGLHHWAQRDGDNADKAERASEYARLLALSKDIDRRGRTRNYGRISDPAVMDRRARPSRRPYGPVTQYNGVPIP